VSEAVHLTDAIPQPGEILAGKYRIERELGRGGMGVVIAAHHVHLDELVAIKFLLPEFARDADVVSRFMREGRASIKIRSEHVVKVFDVATMPGGTPYMVMEYLDGMDLDAHVAKSGRLPIDVAVDYTLQAIEALAEAHSRGLVHRDLKPANLFLTRRADGTSCIKVLDFGITKVTGPEAGLGMTKTNAVMGSPRYMSPEQMRSTRAVDVRADIWALGIVLHEVLAGAPPFDATSMPELLVAILQDPPQPLSRLRPDVPAELERTVFRCLEKDPARRPANVAELAHALAPFGSASARGSAERVSRVLKVPDGAPAQSTGISAVAYTGMNVAPPVPTEAQAGFPAGSTSNAWGDTGQPPMRSAKRLLVALTAAGVLVASLGTLLVVRARHASSKDVDPAASAAVSAPKRTASPPPSDDIPSPSVASDSTTTATSTPALVPTVAPGVAPAASAKGRPRPTGTASPSGTPRSAASRKAPEDNQLFDGRH
jgi:serine/threonine-protein kinase